MTSKYEAIPKETTYALIARAQQGEEEAKTLLVQQNTGLVKHIALKFSGTEDEIEDLIQIGYIGLLKAIEKFNPDYDVMFSTYAVPMIMGEIKRFFRDNGKIKVSRKLKQELHRLKQAEQRLTMMLGRAPRVSETAEALGIEKEDVLALMDAEERLCHVASLDEQGAERAYARQHTVGSPESRLELMMVKQELANLKPKEQQVIAMRFYRDMTQLEVGRLLHISQVQVSRIEKKVLGKMRNALGESGEERVNQSDSK